MKPAPYLYHLMATTAHGIEQCDPLDTIDGDLLPFRDFYSALSSLSNDEVIYTAVDPDQLTELQQDYSVKLLK